MNDSEKEIRLNTSQGLSEFARSISAATHIDNDSVFLGSVTGRRPAPLHLWHPAHCGAINMEIRRDGTWYHDGTPIRRHELMRLFAGILRREDDGDYYLVTPVEKCRVNVALHPLIIIDVSPLEGVDTPTLALHLNSGGTVPLDGDYTLRLEPRAAGAAYVTLPHGLTALFSRAAWVRLVSSADDAGCIQSAGRKICLAE